MKKVMKILLIIITIAIVGLTVFSAQAEEQPPVRLVQTITLPDFRGSMDYIGVDSASQRLFVTGKTQNTLEIIDLKTNTWAYSIKDIPNPHGVVLIPEINRLMVTTGTGSSVKIFDGTTYQVVKELDFGEKTDGLRYEPLSKRAYVACATKIGIINTTTLEIVGTIPAPEGPEAFAFSKDSKFIYVNLAAADSIGVIDLAKQAIVTKWPVTEAKENVPMAIDTAANRVFIVTQSPARLIVFNTDTGKPVANLECGGDADYMTFDAARKRIYVSCGAGFLYVFQEVDPDNYKLIANPPTGYSARTSILAPELNRLYVALPQVKGLPAAIQVYELKP